MVLSIFVPCCRASNASKVKTMFSEAVKSDSFLFAVHATNPPASVAVTGGWN